MGEESWQVLLPQLLRDAGLAATGFEVIPLTGGVSSDIVRIRLSDGRDLCAKRALGQLKVASEWTAPLERNHFEVAWLRRAGAIVPGVAPKVLGEDSVHGIALLEYLPPEDYVLWKAELLAGRADNEVPERVALALGRIHRTTLNDNAVANEFPTDALFNALRLDPYLRFTAGRHRDIAGNILAVLDITAATRIALVHGDVSPKNILVSKRDGHPVLLDAECAWYGDPAFDAAFLLTHLLLKSIHLPTIATTLRRQAVRFARAWLSEIPRDVQSAGLQARVAALLSCLMLARVDGKSPVEYLSEDNRQRVRELAIPLIARPVGTINEVIERVGP